MAAALDDAIAATSITGRTDEAAPALARLREETSFARRALPEVLALRAPVPAGDPGAAGLSEVAGPPSGAALVLEAAPVASRRADRQRND